MSAVSITAATVQVLGGLALAPLLPGLVQHWKARLQGRRGPTPLQPYRELRRLWSKSTVSIEDTSAVYRLAPAMVAASYVGAVLLVPVASAAPDLGIGNDFLVLVGLLALARFAAAVAAWDTSNGFSLMGASRDLLISLYVEVALILSIATTAVVTGTTGITAMIALTAGSTVVASPALILGAAAFAIVVMAESGRQPVDNPDTHLELTMIHEGPLLEYAGRDLLYLQWAAAARHWIVIVLAAQVFLPHASDPWWQLALLPVVLIGLCGLLAFVETVVVKIRILQVPRLITIGSAMALVGIAVHLVEGA